MKQRNIVPAPGDTAQVDLTPMLDVVFILLIFFVVTASFVREQGLPIEPEQPAVTQADGSALVVRIDAKIALGWAGIK